MILPVSHHGIERPQRAHPRPHRPLLALASLVLLAAAFASDVLTGSEVASSLFYVVAITFGAWFVDGRTGRILAVLSVVCWWMAYRIAAKPFTQIAGQRAHIDTAGD